MRQELTRSKLDIPQRVVWGINIHIYLASIVDVVGTDLK